MSINIFRQSTCGLPCCPRLNFLFIFNDSSTISWTYFFFEFSPRWSIDWCHWLQCFKWCIFMKNHCSGCVFRCLEEEWLIHLWLAPRNPRTLFGVITIYSNDTWCDDFRVFPFDEFLIEHVDIVNISFNEISRCRVSTAFRLFLFRRLLVVAIFLILYHLMQLTGLPTICICRWLGNTIDTLCSVS